MKKYLISLEKDQQRRELFFRQSNNDDFIIFQAVNTMNEALSDLHKRFDLSKFLQHYRRNVTKGEVGCTLSHLGVYRMIIEDRDIRDDEYSLICEDDALFTKGFYSYLGHILLSSLSGDIVILGQSKINHFNDIELEINYPITFNFLQKEIKNTPFRLAYPYKNYFAGTVCYLIKKSSAAKILGQCELYLPYWLADDFVLFGNTFNLDTKVIRPLMAIENPILNSNLSQARGEIKQNTIKKWLKYPVKKLLAIIKNLKK